jgi:hypothetical protein
VYRIRVLRHECSTRLVVWSESCVGGQWVENGIRGSWERGWSSPYTASFNLNLTMPRA